MKPGHLHKSVEITPTNHEPVMLVVGHIYFLCIYKVHMLVVSRSATFLMCYVFVQILFARSCFSFRQRRKRQSWLWSFPKGSCLHGKSRRSIRTRHLGWLKGHSGKAAIPGPMVPAFLPFRGFSAFGERHAMSPRRKPDPSNAGSQLNLTSVHAEPPRRAMPTS